MARLISICICFLMIGCQSSNGTKHLNQNYDKFSDQKTNIDLFNVTTGSSFICGEGSELFQCWATKDFSSVVMLEKFSYETRETLKNQRHGLGFSHSEYKKYYNNVIAVHYAQQRFDVPLHSDSYEYLVNRLSWTNTDRPWDQVGLNNGQFCLVRSQGVFDDYNEFVRGNKTIITCRSHYGELSNKDKRYQDTKMADNLDLATSDSDLPNNPISFIYQ